MNVDVELRGLNVDKRIMKVRFMSDSDLKNEPLPMVTF